MTSPAETGGSRASPRVVSEKPPIPTLWLDTSVVVKLVKIGKGENLSAIEVDRTLRLRELVLRLVTDAKLLCPTSDQEEEYEAKRLDSEIFAEFSRLSRGVRMNHRLVVQDAQVYRAMDAFCSGQQEIDLPWRIYFHEDPFRTIERQKDRRFIVSVTTPPGSPLISLQKAAKADVLCHAENLRQELAAKGQSYDDQFGRELEALGATMARMFRDFNGKLALGRPPEFMEMMGISGFLEYLRHWKNLGNPPRDLHKFMVSDWVKSLPAIRIGAQLFADLVTGNQRVMPGDPADVNLLSTAIPVAHFVLTDKRMERRIKRIGVDREWNTKVYSMSTVDDLFSELESLQRAVA